MRPILLTAVTLCVAIATTAAAQDAAPDTMQEVNGQRFGNWEASCETTANDQTVCALSQQLLRESDQVFMAQVLALWSGDRQTAYLSMRVPTGTYLAAGLALRASDATEVHSLTWQSCDAKLCEALMVLTPDIIDQLTTGDGIIISSYRPSMGAEPRIFNFSATGLAEGLAALK